MYSAQSIYPDPETRTPGRVQRPVSKVFKLISADHENAIRRIALRLTDQQFKDAVIRARAYNCTVSEFIRSALENYTPSKSQLKEIEYDDRTSKIKRKARR